MQTCKDTYLQYLTPFVPEEVNPFLHRQLASGSLLHSHFAVCTGDFGSGGSDLRKEVEICFQISGCFVGVGERVKGALDDGEEFVLSGVI